MQDANRGVRIMFSLVLAAALGLIASASALADSAAGIPSESSTIAFVPPAASRACCPSSSTRTWFGVKLAATSSSVSCVEDNRACVAAERSANVGRMRGVWAPQRAQRASSENGMTMAASSAPRIIIAGAPASGKGTQCNMIKEKYGVVHLSTGDMLRAAVKEQTAVGMKAKNFMNEGKLVPDEVIIDIVKDRLAEDDCQQYGWLLDGFPRTRAQADALEAAGIQADSFLLLNVPDEVLIARVVGRRLDPETGDIYHLEYNPPPADVMSRSVE